MKSLRNVAIWTAMTVATVTGCAATGQPPNAADDLARKLHDAWHRLETVADRLDDAYHAAHPLPLRDPPSEPHPDEPILTPTD